MSTSSIENKLRKCKEEEEAYLADFRRKQQIEIENARLSEQRRKDEETIKALMDDNVNLTLELDDLKKENFVLQLEADSWSEVLKNKNKGLEEAKIILNEKQEQIWKKREEFCEQADEFLEKYGVLSSWWQEKREMANDPNRRQTKMLREKMKVEMREKEEEIERVRGEVKEMEEEMERKGREREGREKRVKEMEGIKERLLREPYGPEYTNMKASIELTKERCTQLAQLIADKEQEIQECEETERHSRGLMGVGQCGSSALALATPGDCVLKDGQGGLFSVVDVQTMKMMGMGQGFRSSCELYRERSGRRSYDVFQTFEKSTVMYRGLPPTAERHVSSFPQRAVDPAPCVSGEYDSSDSQD